MGKITQIFLIGLMIECAIFIFWRMCSMGFFRPIKHLFKKKRNKLDAIHETIIENDMYLNKKLNEFRRELVIIKDDLSEIKINKIKKRETFRKKK